MKASVLDQAELLYRHVHPTFIEAGEPSSAAFRPTSKDDGKLSVDRSSISTAEESFKLHVNGKKLQAAGTYGLLVSEFSSVEVSCFPDPLSQSDEQPANPAHAYGDFSHLNSGKQKVAAKKLKRQAIGRGCLHP